MFIIICNKVRFLKFNEFRFNFFISYKNICCSSGINCSGICISGCIRERCNRCSGSGISGISGGGWWYFI